VHTSGVAVDLVPFGEIEEPEGSIQWPGSGAVMTVIGFREGDEHATRIDLAPGVSVRVVTIPTLVILKVVAYYDRRKIDDLADVLFILENYSRYELEDRIFDELAELLARGDLPFEQAGAFLLGRDVAAQCSPPHRPKVKGILDDVLGDREMLARLVPPVIDEESWDKRFTFISDLFRRLTAGFME
jgi:predicted nucleotidyltransferase